MPRVHGQRHGQLGAQRRRIVRRILCLGILLVSWLSGLVPMPARAEEPPRPWAEGVSLERQQEALQKFEDGNHLFTEKKYTEALKTYRDALGLWDHPAIRYNISECLIHLDRPDEAYPNTLAALQYGEQALGARVFARANENKALLEARLGWLSISCDEPGAVVTLNGEHLFTGPGRVTKAVVPRAHQVVARKEGHLTQSSEAVVVAQQTLEVTLQLPVLQPAIVEMQRRWDAWKPWAVLGGGVAVAALGVLFQAQAQAHFDAYDRELLDRCDQGCLPSALPSGVTGMAASAGRENVLSGVAYSVGGVAAAAGVLLIILNQPRPVTVEPPRVIPAVSPQSAGLSLQVPL